MKGSYEFDPQTPPTKGMEAYCRLCGWALALAHSKSVDAAMIAGYLGKTDELDEALTKFALAYSEQNESDYDRLQRAARARRIKVSSICSGAGLTGFSIGAIIFNFRNNLADPTILMQDGIFHRKLSSLSF